MLLKNIDNVVPDGRKPVVQLWKRMLGGACWRSASEAFSHLRALEALDGAAAAGRGGAREAGEFLADELCRACCPHGVAGRRSAGEEAVPDRPPRPPAPRLRRGAQPGGAGRRAVLGRVADGRRSRRRSSRPRRSIPRRPRAAGGSQAVHPLQPGRHRLRPARRHGRPYDLHRFVDPATVFIASKSHEGRPLKALERPGLWNGAMAGWNTVFVEVPDATFAPVKTVLDLLRPEHQPEHPPEFQ